MNLSAAGLILKTKQCDWHSLVGAKHFVAQHREAFQGLKFESTPKIELFQLAVQFAVALSVELVCRQFLLHVFIYSSPLSP